MEEDKEVQVVGQYPDKATVAEEIFKLEMATNMLYSASYNKRLGGPSIEEVKLYQASMSRLAELRKQYAMISAREPTMDDLKRKHPRLAEEELEKNKK